VEGRGKERDMSVRVKDRERKNKLIRRAGRNKECNETDKY
jgi:ribosomal protein L36